MEEAPALATALRHLPPVPRLCGNSIAGGFPRALGPTPSPVLLATLGGAREAWGSGLVSFPL